MSDDEILPRTKTLCFYRRQFVRPLAELRKTTRPIFTKFGEIVAHGPRKKPLDFGVNPDHVWVMVGLGLPLGWAET